MALHVLVPRRRDSEWGFALPPAMGCSSSHVLDSFAEENLQLHLELMFELYGKPTEQVGFTDGHHCITDSDKAEAKQSGASLLYGEILATGVTRILDMRHMRAAKASVLFDLGMGLGKLLLQSFFQYPNIRYVCGVELALSRYRLAEKALLKLVELEKSMFEITQRIPDVMIRVQVIASLGDAGGGAEWRGRRVIEMRRCSMWDVRDIHTADVVFMHTDFTATCVPHLRRLVLEMKRGVRFVTYQDLARFWPAEAHPFAQLKTNLDEQDVFATSWSPDRGYHLYCWEKVVATALASTAVDAEESKESMDEQRSPANSVRTGRTTG